MSEKSITCINGQFVPASEATVSVTDRGFRFGDGVFETVRVVDAVPHQWELHLARLNAGLAALRITAPEVDWMGVARDLIHKNNATSGFLRIAVSRGVGSRGYMPNADIQATWVMEIIPSAALPEEPLSLWLSTITRPPLSSLPANHKLAHGIGSTLALLEARDHGCDEALMLTHDGKLSECASGNIFWISGNQIFTPALSTACLAGTTRDAVMRLSPIRVEEVVADISALTNADAAFISNTRLGVWPIATLAPISKNFDSAHPMIHELNQRLDADRAKYVVTHAAQWQRT
jgi:branched-subunit amino acid aminotransferase/4-amino-4-deoxychorismate lyase